MPPSALLSRRLLLVHALLSRRVSASSAASSTTLAVHGDWRRLSSVVGASHRAQRCAPARPRPPAGAALLRAPHLTPLRRAGMATPPAPLADVRGDRARGRGVGGGRTGGRMASRGGGGLQRPGARTGRGARLPASHGARRLRWPGARLGGSAAATKVGWEMGDDDGGKRRGSPATGCGDLTCDRGVGRGNQGGWEMGDGGRRRGSASTGRSAAGWGVEGGRAGGVARLQAAGIRGGLARGRRGDTVGKKETGGEARWGRKKSEAERAAR